MMHDPINIRFTHKHIRARARSIDCRLCQQLLFTTKCSSFLDF